MDVEQVLEALVVERQIPALGQLGELAAEAG